MTMSVRLNFLSASSAKGISERRGSEQGGQTVELALELLESEGEVENWTGYI